MHHILGLILFMVVWICGIALQEFILNIDGALLMSYGYIVGLMSWSVHSFVTNR
jgi:hypothetical protein